jgi:hypothetical protein
MLIQVLVDLELHDISVKLQWNLEVPSGVSKAVHIQSFNFTFVLEQA